MADVVLLDPGGSIDPTAASGSAYLPLSTFATYRPPLPGRYTFRLVLDTRAPEPAGWLGRFGQDAERDAVLVAVRAVPPVLLAAALAVEVR